MKLILILIFFSTFFSSTQNHGHDCQIRFLFKKVCHRFKIDASCQPPHKTKLCRRTKTTFDDSKCPNYICATSEVLETTKFSSGNGIKTTTSTASQQTTNDHTTTSKVLKFEDLITPFTQETTTTLTTETTALPISTRAPLTQKTTLTTALADFGTRRTKQPTLTTELPIVSRAPTVVSSTFGPSPQTTRHSTTVKIEEKTGMFNESSTNMRHRFKNTLEEVNDDLFSAEVFKVDDMKKSKRRSYSERYLYQKFAKRNMTKIAKQRNQNISNNYGSNLKVIVESNELNISSVEQYRSIDCHDKECSLIHKIVPNCFVYLHTNDSHCNIPCELDGCEKELHHYINCPIWNCRPYTTTTSSTTTSSSTTTLAPTTSSDIRPTPSPIPIATKNLLLYISFSFNLVFIVIIILLSLFIYKKLSYRRRSQNSRNHTRRRVSLLDNNDQYFSIGSASEDSESTENNSEHVPLLERNRTLLNRIANRVPQESIPINDSLPTFQNIDLNSPSSSNDCLEVEIDKARFRHRHGFSTFKGYTNLDQVDLATQQTSL